METEGKLNQVLSRIDQVNAQDPHHIEAQGKKWPHELYYSERLTRWVLKLEPQASECLQIAARGQHIGRWENPRIKYPEGRGGYLRWREDLKKFHAEEVASIMKETGYEVKAIEEVRQIILKRNFKNNADGQVMEDALCLVFLEDQFEDLLKKTKPEKMKEIIRKTWNKMSSRAQKIALDLSLPPAHLKLIRSALAL